ncbi:exodeoxyribonuclease VII small subunit [Secundilactobacillus pentosiphilus]|uniref:Exodeoxyribonuclease 7 small subunit n=1 Tax=Secundilactobacillus pentosiphilus TaxID=1714682 RepID=A0A1Z5ILW7_9LACO|nr:exodeoxyribonuclease VII small subunit [Secundilactobacillus pentosiphilus]GAX02739.1 exodeoxyribonuclease VII small subunit [Secundilactobacillus pentosiphilus]GAX06883.1 exodeoxyribonuclease VII small subunit [Secundilactobacillus pentosiphilus]
MSEKSANQKPAKETPTFEENLNHLEEIVTSLEKGNVPLEEALSQFKQGVALSHDLQVKLTEAEKTLAQMMNDDDQTEPFEVSEDDKNE